MRVCVHVFAGMRGDAAARSTMLPHVSTLIPISARTLARHCTMTQVVHDDVPEHSDKAADADAPTPRHSDTGYAEDNIEGTGRLRNWLKQKLKRAVGIVENNLPQHTTPVATPAPASGGPVASPGPFVAAGSAPVATPATAAVHAVDAGPWWMQGPNAHTSTVSAGVGIGQNPAEGVHHAEPEQSGSAAVHAHHAQYVPTHSTPTRAADIVGPSGTTAVGVGDPGHMHAAHESAHVSSPQRPHVTFCDDASPSPKINNEEGASPSRESAARQGASPTAAAGVRAPGVHGNRNGQAGHADSEPAHGAAQHSVPQPMLTGLDTDSKALFSSVAQGYMV